MQARTITERGMGETRLDRTAADERRMLAVGKRVKHRWVMEMSLGRPHGLPPSRETGPRVV